MYFCDWYTSGAFYIEIISGNQEQAYPLLQELEKETVQLQNIYK
jgi:ribosome maturation protein Sdo1